MLNQFSRTQILIGQDGLNKLQNSSVAVFGIGGVGGYAVEALARVGVGTIGLFDNDKICVTNINRQIIALHSTVGQYKTDVAQKRVLDINPDIKVIKQNIFYSKETSYKIDLSPFDYIIDAIDTVACKLELVEHALRLNKKIISCMGAGNKLNASAFIVDDIFNTSVCPLCRVMRKELKNRGINSLKVVYSKEEPLKPYCILEAEQKDTARRQIPGSVSFVPSAAGLILAGEAVKELLL